MPYFVYMIKTLNSLKNKTYVGYTNNINSRIKKHNNNKGAKSTRGYIWELIYKKKFLKKNDAMSFEYKLKNDRKKRASILKKHNDKRI
tara:strand:- start:629 stop:892 length:264 start_codon:yes stop_codon:yes gene_type:complete